MYPGYNFRNNEIGAVIGLNQLKKLNFNNKKRTKNFKLFLKFLYNKKYLTEFNLKGSSNYAFPLILKNKSFNLRNRLENIMKKNYIEFRRGNAGGGNQLRQPYLKDFVRNRRQIFKFKNTEHVHHFGYYLGNYPNLTTKKIKLLCKILNSLE